MADKCLYSGMLCDADSCVVMNQSMKNVHQHRMNLLEELGMVEDFEEEMGLTK
ncbi:MAG: hypothetical protein ACYTFK_12555 [Planctomycetota bacterium]|jgi:hypothetical protein